RRPALLGKQRPLDASLLVRALLHTGSWTGACHSDARATLPPLRGRVPPPRIAPGRRAVRAWIPLRHEHLHEAVPELRPPDRWHESVDPADSVTALLGPSDGRAG